MLDSSSSHSLDIHPCMQVITAGSYGVKAWTCEMDHEAYRADKVRVDDGKVHVEEETAAGGRSGSLQSQYDWH